MQCPECGSKNVGISVDPIRYKYSIGCNTCGCCEWYKPKQNPIEAFPEWFKDHKTKDVDYSPSYFPNRHRHDNNRTEQ